MGSYASKPIVDKDSQDECNERLNCGASSMQGWRVSQEDAHNCLLDFDSNTSFFAVYDGHGGHEVAQYCSQKLPDYIKNIEAYKEGDIETALVDGFLGLDKTITTPEVITVLKGIAQVEDDEEDSDDEENVNNLYEEAAMPIEQVIEKYTSNLLHPAIKNLKRSDKAPKSPYLKAKKENGPDKDKNVTVTSEDKEEASSSRLISSNSISSSCSRQENNSEVKKESEESNSEAKSNDVKHKIPEIKITSEVQNEASTKQEPKSSSIEPETSDKKTGKNTDNEKLNNEAIPQKTEDEGKIQNGDIVQEEVSSSDIQENGEETPKGKGKAKMKRVVPTPVRVSPRIKESPKQLYKKLLDFGGSEEEDSEDEEDVTFKGTPENSSDDDEENLSNTNVEADSEESCDEEDDEGLEEEEAEEEEDEIDMDFTNNMKEEPGSDSGCTAVVALLKDHKLWVANAGDSRCVVCRNGKAIEMSFDHKPEDEPERDRIVKAGGRVTLDGRVNNGLNLSRAIGDHAYKQNADLGPREQMITALPDVKTLEINEEEDEFMILACDGIWNFMSSQEVIDFIRPKIKENREKLSSICEELFDHCLAPDTLGDGTGCDNMTAIIVQFKQSKKRLASPDETTDSNKRAKTDNEPQSTV